MMKSKKIICFLIIILIIPLFIIGIYKFIEHLDYNSQITSLEKYTLLSNEKIVKNLNIKKFNYVITRYTTNTDTWSHLNILVKDNDNYYMLENIEKCDTTISGENISIKDNNIYIHCIGKKGNIDKYTLDNISINKFTYNFNYDDTPSISELHILIDKVDNENIYLYSVFKEDTTDKNNPTVKCSFNDKICRYY